MYKFLISLLFLIPLVSCGKSDPTQQMSRWMEKNGKLKVLCTTAMIEDVVRHVGGEHIDTAILIKGELDPHSYQLVKGDDEKLAYADIIFYNGLGLEHGPSLQHHLEGSKKAVGLGNEIEKDSPQLILEFRGQRDPHIWMDISLWEKIIPYIVQALSEKDPTHSAYYRDNGERFKAEMEKVHSEIFTELQSIPDSQRYLVTSHDAFNYFTRAYLAGKDEKTRLNGKNGLRLRKG